MSLPLPAFDQALLLNLLRIADRAGDAIMAIYETDFDVEIKGDASPVTAADKAADDIIRELVASEITTAWPMVTEETFDATTSAPEGGRFWLVDPLDGTKEFIKRNGEFTVNIALIEKGVPVLGCVHAPAVGKSYIGGDAGAWSRHGRDSALQTISVRPIPEEGQTVLVSRSHPAPEVDAFLKAQPIAREISAGSSLKFCLVADGSADLYPRFGNTMEWDTAAGHAVLRAAGGFVRDAESGVELTYGKPGFRNPGFIAAGS